VLTENIAFFYIKYESAMIMCFDRQEYFVNYSLDQIQSLLPEKQFYRLNRQYLINFNAVKEVEHYFARKLLVNPVISELTTSRPPFVTDMPFKHVEFSICHNEMTKGVKISAPSSKRDWLQS
jgi:hypothetical protein